MRNLYKNKTRYTIEGLRTILLSGNHTLDDLKTLVPTTDVSTFAIIVFKGRAAYFFLIGGLFRNPKKRQRNGGRVGRLQSCPGTKVWYKLPDKLQNLRGRPRNRRLENLLEAVTMDTD